MSEWISVKDRLPDKAGDYLVALPYKWTGGIDWVIDRIYFRGKTTWATANKRISHWMPLPEPPKAE